MEEIRELYLDWCKEETYNYSLEDKGGVKLALNLLMEIDPLEFGNITSETIDGISQSFAADKKGIPERVFTWLSPYYRIGSLYNGS